jgi:uncharacterized radical SAM superfamily protein
MANYIITKKVIRGTAKAVAAAAETYLETIDSTTQAVVSIDVVGDNNTITMIILHIDTS